MVMKSLDPFAGAKKRFKDIKTTVKGKASSLISKAKGAANKAYEFTADRARALEEARKISAKNRKARKAAKKTFDPTVGGVKGKFSGKGSAGTLKATVKRKTTNLKNKVAAKIVKRASKKAQSAQAGGIKGKFTGTGSATDTVKSIAGRKKQQVKTNVNRKVTQLTTTATATKKRIQTQLKTAQDKVKTLTGTAKQNAMSLVERLKARLKKYDLKKD
jgi:hypothetical protein